MSDTISPEVQDLAEHVLRAEPFRADGVHEARVRALCAAIQEAIDAWLERYPYEGPPE